MTVTYTAEVATCRKFGCFLKLLFRWRGSIYKLVWADLVTFLLTYYSLNFTYRFALSDHEKRTFENVVQYCNNYSSLIPLSFVLGFYVQIVMQRWWEQYETIPWPDSVAVFVSAHIHGEDDRARLMRRTIMRYVCLCQAITFSLISPKVKKRFPTLNHLVDAGLMLDNEKVVFDSLNDAFPKVSKQWMPIVWATSIVTRARKEGIIRDDFAVKTLVDELNKFRGLCGTLLVYDYITIPLVYTQVVTIAVYTFFLSTVIAQQWTEHSLTKTEPKHENQLDLYFPIFTTLQFFFYMGWLKVAESLINPFGEDDDDFEVNWMIDRNLQVSYLIVDEMHQNHPDLVKDQYWDEVFPNELPYDGDVKHEEPPEPSTAKLGERLATMSTIRIVGAKSTQRLSVQSKTQQLDAEPSSLDSERLERFSDLMKRAMSIVSEPDEEDRVSRYATAVPTPAGVRSPQEPKSRTSMVVNLEKAEQEENEEDARPRRIFTEGIFESSIDSIPVEATSEFGGEENEEEQEFETEPRQRGDDEKDDFDKLKEERDRERSRRQRLRFTKQIEEITNIKNERESVAVAAKRADNEEIEEFDSAENVAMEEKAKSAESKDKKSDDEREKSA